jgi:low temperature requirement protein LtrA
VATDGWRYGLWTAALVLQIITPYLNRAGWHTVSATHFVERHGLVIIVALGESIVAIGLGVKEHRLDAGVITIAVLGMCMAYLLWAIYFGGDGTRSEHALDATADPLRRARMALHGWAYAHYPMLLGIIVVAAGVKKAVPQAFEPLKFPYALAIGGGVALFLLGHVWFRRVVRLHGGGIGGDGFRLAGAAAALLSIPLGLVVAVAQLAVFPVLLTIALTVYGIMRSRATGRPVGYVPSFAGRDGDEVP